MQLSDPVSVLPAASPSPSCGASLGSTTDSSAGLSTNADGSTDSFESLLSSSPDDSDADDEAAAPDAVATADLLAVALWMPLAPPAPIAPAADVEVDLTTAPAPTTDVATALATDGVESDENAPATAMPESSTGQQVVPGHDCIRHGKAFGGRGTTAGRAVGHERSVTGIPVVAAPAAQAAAARVPLAANAVASASVATNAPNLVPPVSAETLASPVDANAKPVTPAPTALDFAAEFDAATAAADGSDDAVELLPAGELAGTATPDLVPAGIAARRAAKPSLREKFAAIADAGDAAVKLAKNVREKYFLDSAPKGVTAPSDMVGIDVAKPELTMPAATARPKSAAIIESATSFAFSGNAVGTATITVDAPAPVAAVRQALAAVITAVETLERRADVQQKSVDLNFKVGTETLGLRVELREGAVHTTFRTESSEMNSALAREWHSVVHPVVGPNYRIADPVFSSSSHGQGDSFTGTSSHGSHQQPEQKPASTFASLFSRGYSDVAAPEAAPVAAPAVNSSQLLNALA